MTEVRYEDRYGNEAALQDFYKVVEKKGMTQDEVIKSWFGEVNEKEQQLTEHVERNGGKVLSVISQPISKNKRLVAKYKIDDEATNQYFTKFGTNITFVKSTLHCEAVEAIEGKSFHELFIVGRDNDNNITLKLR